jgi:G6PDH family F420-dependent oxidoreductase
MVKVGYFLASEEFGPNELVEQAKLAEAAGFEALWISDHFHPWTSEQGNSPFVWSAIGGLSQATSLPVMTGVTCPTMRIHPAIIAQAAATSAVMLGGRFSFGVGSGENLNEHIFGDRWPPTDLRLEMLEEAVEVMRLRWEGGVKDHRGKHYTVENAQLYTLPEVSPQVLVSGFGPKSIQLAGCIGDEVRRRVERDLDLEDARLEI